MEEHELDMPVAGAPDAVEGEPVGIPPMGAVDWPVISAWTDALNVPLMPAKFFQKRQHKSIRKSMRAHVNMAEKASAGEEPFVYDTELKRMKLTYGMNLSDSVTGKRVRMDAYYSLPLGRMVMRV